MGPGSRHAPAQIVGRETQLAALGEALTVDESPGRVLLVGGPGAGTTTLWRAGIEIAEARGLRVLVASPGAAEVQLSFAGLADLIADVDLRALAGISPPQLHALEVALQRVAPTRGAPEPSAIAMGLLRALLAVSDRRRPLLIAVDDLQWLDRSSAEALAYAARRLIGHPVGFLLTRRPGADSIVERALAPSPLERIEVGAMSLGATRRMLFERLGLSLRARSMRELLETTGGNPLFALEIGRAILARGAPMIGDELPTPDSVEEVLETRVEELTDSERRLLLVIALSVKPRVTELERVVAPGALEAAIGAELVHLDGVRVRAAHPLLAAAARTHSRPAERRELHLALAQATGSEDVRARHLALAAQRPEEGLAATIAEAAERASARGAREEAAELTGHALRLTPPDSAARDDRLLALAAALVLAGEPQRVTELLEPQLETLPASARARARLLLVDGGAIDSLETFEKHLDRALAEGGADPGLRAAALARRAELWALGPVSRIADAEVWADEALSAANCAGPEEQRLALYALGWLRILRGKPIEELLTRTRSVADPNTTITDSIERVEAVRLVWRGETDQARSRLLALLALANERGEAVSHAFVRLHLCELELRAGAFGATERALDEWGQSRDLDLVVAPHYERCRALLAAGRGSAPEAERWAARAIAAAEPAGIAWDCLEARRAQGIVALLTADGSRARECLRSVWEHSERAGVEDPGAFPVAPDLVEALSEHAELDEAGTVCERLRTLARRSRHPWGLASVRRCEAVVRLASPGYDADAAEALVAAAADYERLGLRFDRARCLLALGRAQRRRNRWGEANRSLERASAAFAQVGAAGWSERCRSELARVGGPRSQPGALTPSERRAAELAAAGLSNKEIASELVITVRTVEAHLSSAYSKLGIRSRALLASRLSGLS